MNSLGRTITRHHNLFVGVMQRIEGGKKFLFSRFLARGKLDIIDEQDIDLAILGSKRFGLLETNGIDEFVSKLFRWYIYDIQPGSFTNMTDGVQHVSFPKANAAI